MARKPKNSLAPGIFQRGKTFWLRYTVQGQQMRISLETEDYAEAVAIANKKRGLVTEKTKSDWVLRFSEYLSEKLKEKVDDRPRFSERTVETVTYAQKSFKEWGGYQSPEEVKPKDLQKYYDAKSKDYSESTLQGYVSKVSVFLNWCKVETDTVKFSGKVKFKDIVISREKIQRLIDSCQRLDLKFILFCGFHAGMRRDEISMAKSAWFDLGAKRITIPAEDDGWATKSGRGRKIPITPLFEKFLRTEFSGWEKQVWMMHEEAEGERYRYDFRKPFEKFMEAQKCEECTPHIMRHSYISHMARAGTSISQLSEWSGDRIQTLEKHYIHGDTDPEQAGRALSGISEAEEARVKQAEMLADFLVEARKSK